ncbi:MAG: 3'-5' exonuclease [Pseudomonadota bacterium]|nr:3'-5' exonuclease [Pseudomonadota bacterium]
MDKTGFEELNKQQKDAVNCSLGNKLILAGAGSGKTKVLTCRVAKLIHSFDVKPSNILALTFTNKAANEMKQRIENLLEISSQGLWFGTFHGICRRFLKIHWKEAKISEFFTILDSQDQHRIIKRVIKTKNLDEGLYDPKKLQSFINRQKDMGKRSDHPSLKDDTYHDIFVEYEAVCRQTNSLDFADLILTTYETLKSQSKVLNYYVKRFQHIMVDEFQDTNTLQFNLLKILNGDDGSLYVVGDDDQSIYAWRGARSKNIKLFQDEFRNVELFKLERNYRSTEKILNVANSLIGNNKDRLGKELWTTSTRGDPVYLYEAYNNDDESRFIVEKIKRFVEEGFKRSDIAILYRSNFLSRRLEEELNSRKIPYRIFGGFRFFERAEIKDVIAYIRLAINFSDGVAFERIINTPPRGIGEKTMDEIRKYAKSNSISLWESIQNLDNLGVTRSLNSMKSFVEIINKISNLAKTTDLKSLVEETIKLSTLKSYYSNQKGEEALSKQENLEELISTAESFQQNNFDSDDLMGEFLDNAALEAGEYQSKTHEDPVQLMTIHSAKGLEFPIVFLTGLEEGIFPNENRNTAEDFLEEERRLCYVAITRAMKILFITYADIRYFHGREQPLIPSRFINEIPNEMLEYIKPTSGGSTFSRSKEKKNHFFKIGQRVRHATFGEGIIQRYEGTRDDLKLHINFDNYGQKILVLNYSNLEFL